MARGISLMEYERGACAAMPALEIAGEHVGMDKAWRAGDRQAARDLYVRTLPLLTLQAVAGCVGPNMP